MISSHEPFKSLLCECNLRSLFRLEVGPAIFMCHGIENLRGQLPAVVAIGHDYNAVTVVVCNKIAPIADIAPSMAEVELSFASSNRNSLSAPDPICYVVL